jgi:hypothetical protein
VSKSLQVYRLLLFEIWIFLQGLDVPKIGEISNFLEVLYVLRMVKFKTAKNKL